MRGSKFALRQCFLTPMPRSLEFDKGGIQMKTRKYLDVGPVHDAKPGEFFDRLVGDYFTEHELGDAKAPDVDEDKIIPFPPQK